MKKVVRRFLQGCSLTAAMFVFQACYGTPEDFNDYQYRLVFKVLDENNNAVDGIRLKLFREYNHQLLPIDDYGLSDSNGVIHAYVWPENILDSKFLFTDAEERFEHMDTTFTRLPETDTINIMLKVKRIADE